MTRVRSCNAFVLLFLALTDVLAANPSVGNGDNPSIERVGVIAIYDIWHTTANATFETRDGLVVTVWPSDPESANWSGETSLAAIVLAGRGDVGETPVAAKVWVRGLEFAADVTTRYLARRGRLVLFFRPSNCGGDRQCLLKLVPVPVELDPGTNQVKLGQELLGEVRPPH
jgi:hypothetical protein